MYLPFLDKAVISPQKTGTHTLHEVGRQMAKDFSSETAVQGHIDYQQTISRVRKYLKEPRGWEPCPVAMHVRCPSDRVPSIIYHQYGKRETADGSEFTLDDVLHQIRIKEFQSVFPPQMNFYSPEVKLYPFEGFPMYRDFLNWNEDIPHIFPSEKKIGWSKESILKHPVYEYFLEQLGHKADFELRKKVGK